MQDGCGSLAIGQNAYDCRNFRKSVYLNATSTLERRFRAVCVVECRPMTANAGINILRYQMFNTQVTDFVNLLEPLRFWLITRRS